MLKKVDIEKKVYNFLTAILSEVNVVKGRQEKWRSGEDYCSYIVKPFSDRCFPRYLVEEQGEGYNLITQLTQDVDIVIDMVGDNAFDNYEILKRGLFDDELYEAGLALKGFKAQAVDNTSLEKEFWKERATGGFSFRFQNETIKEISTIDEVNVEYEFI